MNEIESNKKRDLSIDCIRAFSMIFIVLAHVDPPGILFQLRSFDVVSLVVISVMCMKETDGVKAYFSSVWKRVKRLLIPTYICIVIVLLATLLVCLLTKTQYP